MTAAIMNGQADRIFVDYWQAHEKVQEYQAQVDAFREKAAEHGIDLDDADSSLGDDVPHSESTSSGLTITVESIAPDGCHFFTVTKDEEKILSQGIFVFKEDNRKRFVDDLQKVAQNEKPESIEAVLMRFAKRWDDKQEQRERDSEATRIAGLMETYHIEPPWSSRKLDEADINTEYLIEKVLVKGQQAVIAGASKSMKTSVAVDLALSLAKSSKFLGKFSVPESQKVLFLSAESGEATIQETARRVAFTKGFTLAQDTNITWGFWVPRAKNDEQLEILEHQLDESGASVAVIDPLYQVLDGEDQANLSMNGQQLQAVAMRCQKKGVTPILVDHVKRSSMNAKDYQPLELDDVSGAGKAEFFRQWLLMSRRERFDPENPVHRLWVSVGGSAGHCGLYAVDIDETPDQDTGARIWDVNVSNASEAIEGAQARKDAEKAKREEQKRQKHSESLKDAFIGAGSNGLSKTQAFARAGLNTINGNIALSILLHAGILEDCRVKTGNKEVDGYRRTGKNLDQDDNPDNPDKF